MGWFEDEPPLAGAVWAALRRLAMRAAASWPVWLGAALVLGVLSGVRALRSHPRYRAAVVLRVTEGQVDIPGAALGAGRLRTYVDDLAFTNARLTALMRRHPTQFPDLRDPAEAVEGFRRDFEVSISENDFVEERSRDSPPRSARLEITYFSGSPEVAVTIARELADLVIASALGSQRQALERQRAAFVTAAAGAEADLVTVTRADPLGLDKHTGAVRERVKQARSLVASSTLALKALDEKRAVRFEMVDAGRVPPRVDKTAAAAWALLSSFFGALMAGSLLAGAFDPRALDAEDLGGLGLVVLGCVPALPLGRAARESRGEG